MSPSVIAYGSAGCIVGLTMAFRNGIPLLRSRASRQWPTTIGHIQSAEVEYYSIPLSKGSSSGYAPVIRFEYKADGRHFERTAFVDEALRKREFAQDALMRYNTGQQVSVRYDPSDPARALLEGEYVDGSVPFAVVGCLLTAVGASLIVSALGWL